MDYGGRVNSKPGAGGQMSSQHEGIARRERLKKLAMETMDLSKDPYFIINHHGSFECRLCTTIHKTEGNYLAHTQGRRHQTNLGRRALREAQMQAQSTAIGSSNSMMGSITTGETNGLSSGAIKRSVIKIGRPGYKCFKRYVESEVSGANIRQKCLIFEIMYPQIEENLQPRHRFMSAYEQKVEKADGRYQYLLFAAEPYETIGFKIPNLPVDKSEGKFSSNWDRETKVFKLELMFKHS